jgi:hypothetical protein
MSWPLIWLLGLAIPQMREVSEMPYLWRTPHAVDGAALAAALPEFQLTPLEAAFAAGICTAGERFKVFA